jgi:N-acylglucosamine 2-epimerase
MSEALCALMLAIELTGDEARWLPWLRKVHAFIYSRLCDAPYEWYGYLRRDGSPANACKGGNYKGFFHVPRGLLLSLRSAERHLAKHLSSRDSQASHVDLEG